SAFVTAALDGIVWDDITLREGRIEAAIVNLFDVPTINGTVAASGLSAAGLDVETLQLTANATGRNTQFSGSALLANATSATLAGSLAPMEDRYRVALDNFAVEQGNLAARLAAPATLAVAGDAVRFSGVALAVGSGRISATGSAGEALDIALTVSA